MQSSITKQYNNVELFQLVSRFSASIVAPSQLTIKSTFTIYCHGKGRQQWRWLAAWPHKPRLRETKSQTHHTHGWLMGLVLIPLQCLLHLLCILICYLCVHHHPLLQSFILFFFFWFFPIFYFFFFLFFSSSFYSSSSSSFSSPFSSSSSSFPPHFLLPCLCGLLGSWQEWPRMFGQLNWTMRCQVRLSCSGTTRWDSFVKKSFMFDRFKIGRPNITCSVFNVNQTYI